MSKIKINVCGKDFEIDAKPITIIVGPEISDYNNKYEGCYVLTDSDAIMFHEWIVDNNKQLHPEFYKYLEIYNKEIDIKSHRILYDNPKEFGRGKHQIFGFIDTMLKIQDKCIPIATRGMDNNLHPSRQSALSGLLIAMNKRSKRIVKSYKKLVKIYGEKTIINKLLNGYSIVKS